MSVGQTEVRVDTAHLVYVGPDFCYRTPVLKRAGYHVETCITLDDLHSALKPATDAVLVQQAHSGDVEQLLSLTRSHCSACTVLFQDDPVAEVKAVEFDLVIPSATPPDVWLLDLRSLIERSGVLRLESQRLIENSSALRAESAEVRRQSIAERGRTKLERERPMPDPWAKLFEDEGKS